MTDSPNTNPQTADIRDLNLDQIDVRDRFRGVDEISAQKLALDISKNGLIQFIVVRPVEGGKFKLVVGGHRFRAHQLLDLERIRCDVRDLTDEEAHLVEIGENLLRRDLTDGERVRSLGVWNASMKEEHPEFSKGGDRKSADAIKVQSSHLGTFSELMAEKTGRSRRSNYDDLALFEALGDDLLKQLSGTCIEDNFSQLKALANLKPEDQSKVVKLLVADEIKSVAEGKIKLSGKDVVGEKPEDVWARKARVHWDNGSKPWQDKFLEQIGAVRK